MQRFLAMAIAFLVGTASTAFAHPPVRGGGNYGFTNYRYQGAEVFSMTSPEDPETKEAIRTVMVAAQLMPAIPLALSGATVTFSTSSSPGIAFVGRVGAASFQTNEGETQLSIQLDPPIQMNPTQEGGGKILGLYWKKAGKGPEWWAITDKVNHTGARGVMDIRPPDFYPAR